MENRGDYPMKTRMMLSLGLSALVLGGTMVGCTAGGGTGVASASDRNAAVAEKAAAQNAAKAARALASRDADGAVRFAEAAVQLAPRNADYRMTLAQSYLRAGRFTSARQAYADVLALTPDNGKAALNLALAETAAGDWAAARKTLDDHASTIPVSDLGLALALAGNPTGAVSLLMEAARSPEASAKVRQNLGLSFALAGNWGAARVAASADMSPADVDARLEQWAAFAQPQGAADQVATLLGVTPVADQGQPMALALNAVVPVSEVPIAVAPSAVVPAGPVAAPALLAADTSAPVGTGAARIMFAAPRPVVQPVPAAVRLIRPDAGKTKVAVMVKAKAPVSVAAPIAERAKGDWYVQLGAYENAAVAKDGWMRAKRRFAGFAPIAPTGMPFASKAGSFYRLSIGGFARGDADRLCRRYRATGGSCFVRQNGGDQTAQWLRATGTQLVSR